MPRDVSAGLFLLRKGATPFVLDDMWCRISTVALRTPVGVNVDRFLFYKIEYWLANPIDDNFATAPTPFDIYGVNEWVTRVSLLEYTEDQLSIYAHRDFMRMISTTEVSKLTIPLAWRRLSIALSNKFMYCFYDRATNDPVAKYKSIYHESLYATTGTTPLAWISDAAIGVKIDDSKQSFNISLDPLLSAQWFESFKQQAILPAVYRTFVIKPLSAV